MNKRCLCFGLLLFYLTSCSHSMQDETVDNAHKLETAADSNMVAPDAELLPIEQETELLEETITPETEPETVLETVSFTIDTVGDFVPVGDGESYDFVKEDQNESIRYKVDLAIPSAWYRSGTVAMDEEREKAEIFSTKRMEYYSFLYRTSDISETAVERSTNDGVTYFTWDETSSTMDAYGVIYTHAVFPLSAEDETLWFHIYFLTYSDDRAGYYEEVILPIINGTEIVRLTSTDGIV